MCSPINSCEVEFWTPMPGYPKYLVSDKGRIKSLRYNRQSFSKILKGKMPPTGRYYMVNIGKMRSVHSIVAEAFMGKRPDGLVVNHMDGNKLNNRLENLEYCSPKMNAEHAARNGLLKTMSGELCGHSKVSENQVMEIRMRHKNGESQSLLGREFGINQSTVWELVHGTTWKHLPV